MYGPRPIRFPAHWCADYSKYRGFWQAVFQSPRPYSLFLEHGSAAKTLISHPHNTASYAGYFKCNLKCYESKNFSVPSLQRIFSKKNSLTCGVKCDTEFNLRKSQGNQKFLAFLKLQKVIENSRRFLLPPTDILQKTVVGCP